MNSKSPFPLDGMDLGSDSNIVPVPRIVFPTLPESRSARYIRTYSGVLYCCVVLCCIISYSLNSTIFNIVLHCTVLYCTVLYCTVLYCTVLYCTVLYCTVLYWFSVRTFFHFIFIYLLAASISFIISIRFYIFEFFQSQILICLICLYFQDYYFDDCYLITFTFALFCCQYWSSDFFFFFNTFFTF